MWVRLLGGLGAFQSLQFLAGLEAHGFSRRDADFFAGARVASNASLTRFHTEYAKAAQLNALALAQSGLQRFEYRFHSLLGLGATDISLVTTAFTMSSLIKPASRVRWQMLECAPQVVKT